MEPHKIKDVAVTIIDVSVSLKNNNTHPEMFSSHQMPFSSNVKVFDQSALSLEAKEEVYKGGDGRELSIPVQEC